MNHLPCLCPSLNLNSKTKSQGGNTFTSTSAMHPNFLRGNCGGHSSPPLPWRQVATFTQTCGALGSFMSPVLRAGIPRSFILFIWNGKCLENLWYKVRKFLQTIWVCVLETEGRNIYYFPNFFKFGRSRKSAYAYVVGMEENGTLTYAKKKKWVYTLKPWVAGYQYSTQILLNYLCQGKEILGSIL